MDTLLSIVAYASIARKQIICNILQNTNLATNLYYNISTEPIKSHESNFRAIMHLSKYSKRYCAKM